MIGNAPTSYVRSVMPLDLARRPGLTGRFLGPCLRFLAMGGGGGAGGAGLGGSPEGALTLCRLNRPDELAASPANIRENRTPTWSLSPVITLGFAREQHVAREFPGKRALSASRVQNRRGVARTGRPRLRRGRFVRAAPRMSHAAAHETRTNRPLSLRRRLRPGSRRGGLPVRATHR